MCHTVSLFFPRVIVQCCIVSPFMPRPFKEPLRRAEEQSAPCQQRWMNPVAYCWGEHIIWIWPISCNKRAVVVYEIFIKSIPWRLACIQMHISEAETDVRLRAATGSFWTFKADGHKRSDLYGGCVSLSLRLFSAIPPPNKSTRARSGIQQLSGI